MELKKAIEVFTKVREYYIKGIKLDSHKFICYATLYLHNINEMYQVRMLFTKNGYYRNYVVNQTLMLGVDPFDTKAVVTAKIDFLTTEIKELKALLKQGYTHI